jgi:hypothetical protein
MKNEVHLCFRDGYISCYSITETNLINHQSLESILSSGLEIHPKEFLHKHVKQCLADFS